MPSISRYVFTSSLQIFWASTRQHRAYTTYIDLHITEARPFTTHFFLCSFSPRKRRSARLKHLKRSNIGCADQRIVPRLQLQMMWVAEERVTSEFQPCHNSSHGSLREYSSFKPGWCWPVRDKDHHLRSSCSGIMIRDGV